MLNFGPAPTSNSVEQLFAQAVTHHQAGRLAQAEPLYRQVLAIQPHHADALHMLGALAAQVEKYDAAIDLIERAVVLNPGNAVFHGNLGETYRKAGKLPQAEA